MSSDPFDPFRQNTDNPPGSSWDELFARPKHRFGGVGARKKADSEAAQQPEEDAEGEIAKVEDPPPPAKPEIVLFNAKWGGEKGFFNQKMAVSVEGTLPPESSHLTKVTFTVNAILPDGKPNRIEAKKCHYLFKVKHRASRELESGNLPATGDIIHRVRHSGILFDANKCFLLPEGGEPYYTGNASGVADGKTKAALKAFQEATNKEKGAPLPTDGKGDFEAAGRPFRR